MSALRLPSTARLRESHPLQIGLIMVFWMAGETFSRMTGVPVPGSVIGLFLALALLAAGWVKPAAMRRGAQWLMAEMLLFFIPAVLAVLDHREFLGLLGLKILAVILAGTVVVMGATALAVELVLRFSAVRGGPDDL
ncbi:CidA/LrgA family protein [Rhizobium binxianense]